MENELREAHEYLDGGGLGELSQFTSHIANMGGEKVIIDTVVMLAMIELANEAIEMRRSSSVTKH